MPQTFHITVKALIQNNGKYLLLTKERKGKMYWDLPGGRVEGGDSFELTLERELAEEVPGVKDIVVGPRLNTVWELPSRFIESDVRQLTMFYIVEAVIAKLNLSEEHSGFLWVGNDSYSKVKTQNDVILLEGYSYALEEALGTDS